MKKTIFALFVLLLLLMVTCVYQKTPILYANSAGKHITPPDVIETETVIVVKESVKTPIIPVKEKITVAKTIEKKSEVKTLVQREQSTLAQTEKNTPKPVLTQNSDLEEEEEQTLLSKLKAVVLKRLRTNDQEAEERYLEERKPAISENAPASEKTPAVIEDISLTVTCNTSEEEIINHLVEALRNQDLAFKNRDKFLLEIEALIKRALEDRFIAIENRKKEDQVLDKAQKVLLEERETVSKNVPKTYTITPGE